MGWRYPSLMKGCRLAMRAGGTIRSTHVPNFAGASHGTMQAMDAGSDYVPFNGSMFFDLQGTTGDEERIEVPAFKANARFTAVVWVRPSRTGVHNPIGVTNSSFTRSQFYLRFANTITASGFTTDAGAFQQVNMSPVAANELACLALRYDGVALTSWKDGKLYASNAHTTTPWTTASTLALGRSGDYDGQYFNGLLASAFVYNRGLTGAELRLHARHPDIAFTALTWRGSRNTVAVGGASQTGNLMLLGVG